MKKGFAALMQRVGMLEKTVDAEFEAEREAWKAFLAEAGDVAAALRAQSDAARTAVAPLQAVDSALRDVYAEDHPAYIAWQKAFVTTNSALLVFLDEQQKEVEAVAEHVAAVGALKADAADRDARLLAVDRAHSALEKAQQHAADAAKLQHAEEKHRTLREAYDATNAAVLQRMREARLQRPYRFDVHVRAALSAQARFLASAAAAFAAAAALKAPTAAASASSAEKQQPADETAPPRPPKDGTAATTPTTPAEGSASISAAKLGVRVLPQSEAAAKEASPPAEPSSSASASDAPPPKPAKEAAQPPQTTTTTTTTPAAPQTAAPAPPK